VLKFSVKMVRGGVLLEVEEGVWASSGESLTSLNRGYRLLQDRPLEKYLAKGCCLSSAVKGKGSLIV